MIHGFVRDFKHGARLSSAAARSFAGRRGKFRVCEDEKVKLDALNEIKVVFQKVDAKREKELSELLAK